MIRPRGQESNGQKLQDRSAGTGQRDRTAGQGSRQDHIAETGQRGKDFQNIRAGTGQKGEDSREKKQPW